MQRFRTALCGAIIDPTHFVDQGDIFKYNIQPYGKITVKLFLFLGGIVFESIKTKDSFQFKKSGLYRLVVDSTTNFSRQITFFLNKKCTSIKDFVSNWIQSSSGSLTTPEQVHILLTINRIGLGPLVMTFMNT